MYSFLSIYTQAANEDKVMKQLATGSFSFNGCRILKGAEFELTSVYDREHDIYFLDVDILQLLLLMEYRKSVNKNLINIHIESGPLTQRVTFLLPWTRHCWRIHTEFWTCFGAC
jgi:hypothetical protein